MGIKEKLDSKNYSSIPELITDIRKVFYNCKKFHKKGTQFVAHARKLEDHLDKTLQEWVPEHAYEEYEPEALESKEKSKSSQKSKRSENSSSASSPSKRNKQTPEYNDFEKPSTSGRKNKSTNSSTRSQL